MGRLIVCVQGSSHTYERLSESLWGRQPSSLCGEIGRTGKFTKSLTGSMFRTGGFSDLPPSLPDCCMERSPEFPASADKRCTAKCTGADGFTWPGRTGRFTELGVTAFKRCTGKFTSLFLSETRSGLHEVQTNQSWRDCVTGERRWLSREDVEPGVRGSSCARCT